MPRLLTIRRLSLAAACSMVGLWTLLRHVTNGVNFDVVGQIGLADQWTHGWQGGAEVGSTHYLLKLPLYIAANSLTFISPMNRLLLLALICNIITFIILFKLVEKILALYSDSSEDPAAPVWLWLAFGWLATIAGSVFWVDYANSRNLEVAGGVAFLYLALAYLKAGRRSTAGWLVACGSLVFFADPLQLFVIGGGVCVYAFGLAAYNLYNHHRRQFRQAASLLGLTLLAYIGSKLLQLLSLWLLPVTFLTAPATPVTLSVTYMLTALKQSWLSTLDIFGANFLERPYTPNSIRELINAGILAAVTGFIIWLLIKKPRRRRNLVAMVACICVNYALYIVSGQAVQADTSRYLILVPVLTVNIIAFFGGAIPRPYQRPVRLAWGAALILSGCLLIGALAVSWPQRHSKDAYIATSLSFMQRHHFRYAVSSREIGIPATYFGQRRLTILPTACMADKSLQRSDLFFDQAAFGDLERYKGEVPIILQGNDIKYADFHCNKADVIAQFGPPKYELALPNFGVAVVYDAANLKLTD